jgi:ABC-2 type transport system permease protein
MRTAFLITLKDLRQRVRDRSVILFAVVAPLGLAVIFSQLLAGTVDFRASYLVADLDRGDIARTFRVDVLGAMSKAGFAEIAEISSATAARDRVEDGAVDAAFVIPAGFSAAIAARQPATIEVYGARDEGLATEIARSVAARFADGVAAVQLAVLTVGDMEGRPVGEDQLAAIVAAASRPAITLVDEQASLRQLSASTYFSASMSILFLFFAAQVGIVSLIEERRLGTLGRMLAGPIRPATILLGKTLGSFITGVVALVVLVVATTLLIGADWGPPVGVGAIVVAAVIAAIGITTLVTSFMTTMDGAGAANAAVAITLGILGGTFAPTSQAPDLMSTLSLATPHAWFLRGLGDMQGGGTAADALPAVAVLLGMGLATGLAGFARARGMVRPR